MPTTKKRCIFCHDWFTPDARSKHQVCCSKPECRRLRKRMANLNWRRKNPGYEKTRAAKLRIWARRRGYWRWYRESHPAYAAADSKRRCRAYKASRISAKQDARRQIAVEQLASTHKNDPNPSAKQDAIARRIEIIAEYLFFSAPSAKPNDTDQRLSGGP